MLPLLASAGCAAGGRSAHTTYRAVTPHDVASTAIRPLDLSGLGEPRILADNDSAGERGATEATKESDAALDCIYADGYLIDLTPSPLREVCYESSACCGSMWCGALGPSELEFLHNVHQHCRATCATGLGCGQEFLAESWLDYQGFYSLRGAAIVGTQVGVAAVLANTSLDEDFQNWHDDNIKSSGSDDFADAVNWLGDGRIMIPVVAGAAVLECFARDDQPVLRGIGHWGNRCSRSMLVGGPTVLGLQYLLGASRPAEGRGSSWRPFDDNNSVSGHAFIGATPFLNAVHMTESLPLKVTFYGLSTLPAWSRVNDQRHYLSQVLLGWGIAWLAADVVDRTERSQQNWMVVPYAAEGSMGLQSIVAF